MIALFVVTACGSDGGGGDEGSTVYVYSQSIEVQAEASNQQVTLSNLNAPIEAISVQDNWLKVEAMPYTSGAPVVKLTATDNPNTTERRTKVIVRATSQDRVELTVTQKGKTPAPPEDDTIENLHDVVTDQPAYAPTRPQTDF